jgi:hypothetical protein
LPASSRKHLRSFHLQQTAAATPLDTSHCQPLQPMNTALDLTLLGDPPLADKGSLPQLQVVTAHITATSSRFCRRAGSAGGSSPASKEACKCARGCGCGCCCLAPLDAVADVRVVNLACRHSTQQLDSGVSMRMATVAKCLLQHVFTNSASTTAAALSSAVFCQQQHQRCLQALLEISNTETS